MRIAVVGAGYVGLCVCGFFAQRGHAVFCAEKDAAKVERLRAGELPFFEEGLLELLQRNAVRIEYGSIGNISQADVVFLCVGTPQGAAGRLDVREVFSAADAVADTMADGCLIAIKSTVPVGTGDEVARRIGLRAGGRAFDVCSVPEFLSQGRAVADVLHPRRVVAGAETDGARGKLRALYEGNALCEVTRREAELVKLAANAYLALRISFVNELANLCEAADADIGRVAAAVGADARIGSDYFTPGAGYGGSCLPKDTAALLAVAREMGSPFYTVAAAQQANERQLLLPVFKARRHLRSFFQRKVAILGVSFKAGTDDIRNAPSLVTLQALLREGAHVSVWDGAALARLADYPVERCERIEDALRGAEVCFLFADWPQLRALGAQDYIRLMRRPLVIDARNGGDAQALHAGGVLCETFGKNFQFVHNN